MSKVLSILALLGCLTLAGAQNATVWVASPWQHVLKATDPGPGREIKLVAAANEYEPARIIVRANLEALPNVSLKASSLRSTRTVIPARNITLYREHYLNVFAPSYASKAPTGWYPDALIPFADPLTAKDLSGAKYDATPYTIEPNCNQGYWIDVYVPRGTLEGTYKGEVAVTSGGKPITKVPLTLTVRRFALPDTIAMASNFGSLGGVPKKLGLDPASPEWAAAHDQYIDAFLAHRCVPSGLGAIWPKVNDDGTVDDSLTGERLRKLVVEKHVNALAMPFPWSSGPDKCKLVLRAYAKYLREKGWLDLAYIYLRDEPNNAEDYEVVRKQGELIKEADPGIGRMCTEQTKTSNPDWGTLYGAVNIWCPLWFLHDETTGRERQAAGEKLWSYTALCQGNGAPFWQVDFAPVHFRAPFWTSWHFDIKGFLYWSSVYWSPYEDVWSKPHFRDRYWGEGMLVYPGNEAGITGPVPSIRLKLVREAMEDYEYMALAAKQGKKAQVDAIVDGISTSFVKWSQDPEEYMKAREDLARLIR